MEVIPKLSDLFESGTIKGDALRIYAIQFFTLVAGLVGGIIVARTLGPADKGIVDLFNLLNSFIIDFGLLGFGSGLLYYLANKGRQLGEVHGTGLIFALFVGFLSIMIGWLGLPIWKSTFPGLNEWVILLAFLLSPVSYYLLIWGNIMTGINQAVRSYQLGLFIAALSLSAVLFLWLSGWLNVVSMISLAALITVVNGLIAILILQKIEPRFRPSFSLARDSLRYGLIIYIGFIANVMHFKIDQVMINYWLGTAAVGIYAVSVRWAEMLFFLDSAIIAAALYKISSSSETESYALTKRLFKAQFVISGVSGVVLAALAFPLVLKFYGEAFREAAWPLIFLIPGIVAWSVSKILSQNLSFNRGRFLLLTSFALLGALVNILLNFLLIRKYGINGAAIASTVSYLGVTLLVVNAFQKYD